MNKELFEWAKVIAPVIVAFVGAYFAYRFALKGKLKDVDLQQKKVLNNVLSNLLMARLYLIKLEDIAYLKYEDNIALPFPKRHISMLFLNSGIVNDSCFEDLEQSVSELKEHDPLIFYNLEGVGKRFDFLKKSFIIPLIKSKTQTEFNKSASAKYLSKIIAEVNGLIIDVTIRIEPKLLKEVKRKLKRDSAQEINELKNELFRLIYEMFTSNMPNHHVTFEAFVQEISTPEVQKELEKQFAFFDQIDIRQLLEETAQNPDISLDVILQKQEKSKEPAH